MSVGELALASHIGRDRDATLESAARELSDWFLRRISPPDLQPLLNSMSSAGFIIPDASTSSGYTLTIDGVDAVTCLYGGSIRMIDRGEGIINASWVLNRLGLQEG
jgi:DNA-binding PadR family transcriptional regulator